MPSDRLAGAVAAIDEANSHDPNVLVIDGIERPKEQAHAEMMTACVEDAALRPFGPRGRGEKREREQTESHHAASLMSPQEGLLKAHSTRCAIPMRRAAFHSATFLQ